MRRLLDAAVRLVGGVSLVAHSVKFVAPEALDVSLEVVGERRRRASWSRRSSW